MLNIRSARADDAAIIAEIQLLTWKEAYVGLMPDEFLNKSCLSKQEIEHWQELIEKENTLTLVAEENGRIVGYLYAGEGRFLHIPYQIELYSFYVLPEFQNMGIGKALFEAFMGHYSGGSLFVCSVKGNSHAAAFYRKQKGVLIPAYDFVSSTNHFPVSEEVFVWGEPCRVEAPYEAGAAANPLFW